MAKAGKPVDVKDTTERFSLDVIGKCAFSLQFNSLKESDLLYHEVGTAFSNTGFINMLRVALTFIYPDLLKFLGVKLVSSKVENFFFNLLHRAEELHHKEPNHRGDILQLMLDMKHQGDKIPIRPD